MLHDMVHDMVHDIGGDMLHLRAGFTEIDLWMDSRQIFRRNFHLHFWRQFSRCFLDRAERLRTRPCLGSIDFGAVF
jgi:hypothetical protein